MMSIYKRSMQTMQTSFIAALLLPRDHFLLARLLESSNVAKPCSIMMLT